MALIEWSGVSGVQYEEGGRGTFSSPLRYNILTTEDTSLIKALLLVGAATASVFMYVRRPNLKVFWTEKVFFAFS